jgi:hypothetical protein
LNPNATLHSQGIKEHDPVKLEYNYLPRINAADNETSVFLKYIQVINEKWWHLK